jgi:sec-independent protein translocase protein TatC
MDESKQGVTPPGSDTAPTGGEAGFAGEQPYTGKPGATSNYGDPYGSHEEASTAVVPAGTGGKNPPPVPSAGSDDEDEGDDDGMLRMSFMEHLEELRTRIIRALYGLGIAFLGTLLFADRLWTIISDPATDALKKLGVNPPRLVTTTPMEAFSIIWVKLPLLVAIFLASPWVLYQVWAFIAPGLYKRERRMATPFILCTAGLFISGGVFAYFLAFRFGLQFLLGIGMMNNVQPMVTITEYTDLFINVMLGVSLVFELPVLIFFLTLLRIASPRFLFRHSRYAVLAIVILAAIVTPTPDFFNLMLFAVPMTLLYFAGVFASYLLVLRREGKNFPWKWMLLGLLAVIVILAGLALLAVARFHYHWIPYWPFLTR